MNPIENYYKRYYRLAKEKNISSETERILQLIEEDPAGLNNFFMAGLGLCTLMLRMGAVIQLCQNFESLDDQGDALFMKQVVDNLRETLPTDDNWRNLWVLSAKEDSPWHKPAIQLENGQSLLSKFVTFRNRFVHQQIRIIPEHVNELSKGIELLNKFAQLHDLFSDGEIVLTDGKYFWKTALGATALYPYVQVGKDKESPYIFQGLYQNKTKAHLLNTRFGDETDQDAQEHLEPIFTPIREALRGGAGQVFVHAERLAYYRSCFVGRERERDAIMQFCKSKDAKNILPIKAPAGMGKGALISDAIYQLKEEKIQVLYHFCGAGIQNSLHAALYHFILQGKGKDKSSEGGEFWNPKEETLQKKINRLPSKYIDVIHLFQQLLTKDNLKLHGKNKSGNLVIIIDGLDEAQVAYAQLKISDWFYTYNEKEEPEEDWRSASNIRWIFTYRCDEDGSESFYRFPSMKECAEIPMLQPLQGLSPEAVDEAFKDFKVSADFRDAVINKAKIHTS
jgi:hypothetical protein